MRRTSGVLHACDKVALCQGAEVLVHASIAQARDLHDQGGGHHLVVLRAHFYLNAAGNRGVSMHERGGIAWDLAHRGKDSEFIRGDIAQVCRIEFHFCEGF